MMTNYFYFTLGIIDKLNEWNDQLNKLASKYMDNVVTGTIIFFALIVVAFWAVGELNRKSK